MPSHFWAVTLRCFVVVAEISGKPVPPLLEGQAMPIFLDLLNLEDEIKNLYRNVGSQPQTTKNAGIRPIIIIMDVSFHRPFLPGTSLESAVIPTTQTSSFTLQYYYYYYHHHCLLYVGYLHTYS